MVKAADLIVRFYEALNCGGGYIYGSRGQLWTQAAQNRATRAQTIEYGQQWVGHRVWDCSGLAYWAFEQLGGYVYHGSNTIWNQYVTRRAKLIGGKRESGEMLPGDPVFLTRMQDGKPNRHHIGYYVGNDTVIEAKGTKWGVVTSRLDHWDETAHWVNVEYEGGLIYMNMPTLRRGASGEDVKTLQNLLNENGYALTVDGKFGAATQEAVKDYQTAHGLVSDGIVGAATWDSLLSDPEPGDTVTVSRDDLAAWRKQIEDVAGKINKVLG